jgi:hypothetical protein
VFYHLSIISIVKNPSQSGFLFWCSSKLSVEDGFARNVLPHPAHMRNFPSFFSFCFMFYLGGGYINTWCKYR